jgi:hypothetical protein
MISFETEAGKEYSLNGELQFDGEELQNLALGKKVTASGSDNGETPEMAVDGDASTKWYHNDGIGGEWIQVDLEKECNIQRWSAKFAGLKEKNTFDPRDFVLKASSDGENWTNITEVFGNTKSSCGRNVSGVNARYVRLEIRTSTQDNSGGARVYELEIWGNNGKPPVPKTAYKNYGCSSYNFMRGEIRKDDSGNTAIGYITDGSYIVFRKLDFESGAEGFKVRAASATDGGTIEVRLGSADGDIIGKCDVPTTDGWDEYVDLECATSQCTGEHDVYLVFRGGDGYLFNVNNFSFYGLSGDVNGDREVDIFDVLRFRKALIKQTELSGLGLSNSDLNSDSESNVADLLLLQKFMLGKG